MKLPINPLLYLASLACAGGIVLSIMGTINPETKWSSRVTEKQIKQRVDGLVDKGKKILPDSDRWRYDDKDPFWLQFKTANFTGYVPPEPVAVEKTNDNTPKIATDIDLSQKLEVMCISHGGEHTRVVVRYLESVEVPKMFVVQKPGPGDVGTPMNRDGGAGMNRGTGGDVIGNLAGGPPPHHVKLGEALWSPFNKFYLAEVATDARSVFFENRGKEKVEGKFPRQEVIKNELGLPEDVAKKLVADARRSEAKTKPKKPAVAKKPESRWKDVAKTRAIQENEWVVSRKDYDYVNQRGSKFIHEDVNLGDYSRGTGRNKVQGVSVRKLGKRARGMGVVEGDVIISINNIPVKNRAQAIREGKRLYRKGVRTFKAVVLRRGREITLTHHFPDKKK